MNENFKQKVLNMIKDDVKNNLNISHEKELEHIANNLFEYCVLKLKNTDNQIIADKIMSLNNSFIKYIQENNIEINFDNLNLDLNVFKDLQDKYNNIIKEGL